MELDLPCSGPRGCAVAAVLTVMRDGLPLRGSRWLDNLSQRDKGLAFQITMGSLRHYSRLAAQLGQCMQRPLPAKHHFVKAVLVTALYQAHFLRVPARAAVHEAVALVKNSKEKAMAPFCNAVLRKAVSMDWDALLHEIADPMARLALETSHPPWLVRRWWDELGEVLCRQRLEAGNQQPPLTLRLHGDSGGQHVILERLLSLGAKICPETPGAVLLDSGGIVENLPGYAEGKFAVADQGAQWIARLLNPQPGERILDACAAPGGKTAHLMQLAGGKVKLTTVDKSSSRLQRLRENLRRLRIEEVETVVGDAADDRLLEGRSFSRALVDAPCTGTGIIRRHPEIKWLRQPGDPERMQLEQLAILTGTAKRVDSGGVLLYATCSMEPEENQGVVSLFLASHPQWHLDPIIPETEGLPSTWINNNGQFQTWPGLCDMDGFFAARLVRVA
ncbi:MAG: 16S rRNA m(5)C-967 methyltransferase [Magnetococcales bacterium]|nr:16S rRNA m(5)C-967 methyltransferase [Magnetococcales bacterium]HIJ83109.1 16S rRNA (cytosine(967)-C(5))-methyltransferase RsmB [Magnetococcales bacterium]